MTASAVACAFAAACLTSSPANAKADGARPVAAIDLSQVRAQTRVIDTVLEPTTRARAAAVRTETFTDAHGHRIEIATDYTDVALAPFAQVLASVEHGWEIEQLSVEAVRMSDMPRVCHAEAVACYQAVDGDASPAGRMWFAVDDPDYVHTIVHEYGHHIDNQLLNLRHLGMGCGYLGDGSRNWFFERQIEDDILDGGFGCAADRAWEFLLGELFAEDFVAYNGISNWMLTSARSPTRVQLAALGADIADPFEPTELSGARTLRRNGFRLVPFRLDDWSFVTLTLDGPRRADFDLFLYRAGGRKPFDRSVRRGSRERIRQVLPPGRYQLGIAAYVGSGRARFRVLQD